MREKAFIAPSETGGKEEGEGKDYFPFSLGSQAAMQRVASIETAQTGHLVLGI